VASRLIVRLLQRWALLASTNSSFDYCLAVISTYVETIHNRPLMFKFTSLSSGLKKREKFVFHHVTNLSYFGSNIAATI
jgi:hypothetical protein